MIDWESYEGYAFTEVYDDLKMDLDISDFYAYRHDIMEDMDWNTLKRLSIYLKYANNEFRLSAPLWRFIDFEANWKGATYCFLTWEMVSY